MKFGRNLPRNQVPEWSSSYINYKGLKRLIKAAAAVPEPDLAGFFFALDRNLEDVDSFYNKKFQDASRRLKLLQEHDDDDELIGALLELRGQLRKLQWFGEVNRRGFIKITKKLDKKVNVCLQQPYIASRVDPKPFATNEALSKSMKVINDWLSDLGDVKPPDARSKRPSMTHRASVHLPSALIDTVDQAIRNDNVSVLEETLQEPNLEPNDTALQKLHLTLLQRSISSKSKGCIAFLLKQVKSLDEPEEMNQRNCIHRLVMSIGRSRNDVPSDSIKFLHPAAHPLFGPLSAKTQEAQNAESVALLSFMVERLVDKQREALSAKDAYGRKPLHYAAQFGLVLVCELLTKNMRAWGQFDVTNGLDSPEWQDGEGLAPLHLSVIGGHTITTKVLLNAEDWKGGRNSKRDSKFNAVLALATKSNFIEIVELLVKAEVDLNWQDQNGETALHVAARFGHDKCAKILLNGTNSQKLDVDAVESNFSWTALHVAAVDGSLSIVELLITAGADLNRPDASGWTAREHAALRGHIDIARRLAEVAPLGSSRSDFDETSKAASSPLLVSSLEDRRSKGILRTTQPVKTFGHRYLTNESMILVSLGSMDARKEIDPVQLESVPISAAHATQLDTALSVVVSAIGAQGEPSIVDLPIQDNISTEPVIFTAPDASKVKLLFDIVPTYSGSEKHKIGRAVALLSSIKPSVGSKRTTLYGDLTLPIVAMDTLEVIGNVNFSFLVITPFSHPNMEVTEKQTYWKSMSTPMVIGHRGLGKNENKNRSLQLGENTIQSFITAANLGAQYVEFDVQLTKDLVPVIYHDFLVSETGIDAPVHALTLEQFLHLNRDSPHSSREPPLQKAPFQPLRGMDKPRSLSLGYPILDSDMDEKMKHTRDFKEKGWKANSRGHFIQAPFTTLEEMFAKLPESIGFNIEMKYPMLYESVEQDMDAYAVELNSFCDQVLTKVYDLGKKRNIIFSSFHPDVCILLSFKQPSIPILFLTEGGTSAVDDVRASSLQEAIRFASRWNLLGIVSAAEPLCNSPRLVKVVKEHGLVCVSYGTLNNDPKNVKQQVKEGIDAVIVDSVLAIRKGLQQSSELTQATRPLATLPNGTK